MRHSQDRSVAREQRRREKESIISLFENYDVSARCKICESKLVIDTEVLTRAVCVHCGITVDLTESLKNATEYLEAEGIGNPLLESADDDGPDSVEDKEREAIESKGHSNVRVRVFKP
jgi:hypothetical protein